MKENDTHISIDCQPTDATIEVSERGPTNSASNVHTFFRFQPPPASTSTNKQSNQPRISKVAGPGQAQRAAATVNDMSINLLTRPLPLPSHSKLTRTQLVFSVATSIDPRMLRINGDTEFYLFMDMRAEFQWTSFAMSSQKWASATHIYNSRLEDAAKKKGVLAIKKNPHALMDKLAEIEQKISERMIKQHFNCKFSPYPLPSYLT